MNLFELFVKIGVDDQASGKLSGLSSKLGKGLQTAAKVGVAAVTAVGSGIAALGTYAAKVGGDFEAQMSKVSAISGATGDDLQALEDKAKQLGIDTKFSATEAGKAFEYMAMAGWKTEQMLDGVAGIMDLAAASGEDLASVSDIVTDAMTAFGLSADQSTHFADVLAKASSSANTNVGLMGETFKYVAPVAGAMGFSIEDTATAIGLMANAGIKGSQAGTALRAMISRLVKPTDDSAAAMERLGISITNSDGTVKDFDTILGDLRSSFSKLGDAEKAETAALLAGQEAMSGMLAIVNASETDFNKLTEAINNADSASKQMADTMANNLQGQFTLLKSSAEGFGLALYDKIQQPLTDMVSWAVDGLNQLTKAFNENGVDGLVEAVGNILSEAINEIVNGLPKIVDLAIQIIDSFIGGLNDNLDTIVSGAISVVMTLADGILSMLPQIISLGFDLIASLATGIANSLPTLIPTIIDAVMLIVDTLTSPEMLSKIFDAALLLLIELSFGLMDAIPQLVDSALIIIERLVEFLLDPENLGKLINAAIQIVVALGVGLVKAIPRLIKSAIKLVADLVKFFFDYDWGKLGKNIVDGLLSGLKRAWESLKKWVSNAWDSLVGGIKDFLGIHSPSRVFAGIGKNMALGVGEGWDDAFGDVEDDINSSMDFGESDYGITTSSTSISDFGGGSSRYGYGGSNVNVTVGIDDSANAMGLARALLPFLKIAEKEVYA